MSLMLWRFPIHYYEPFAGMAWQVAIVRTTNYDCVADVIILRNEQAGNSMKQPIKVLQFCHSVRYSTKAIKASSVLNPDPGYLTSLALGRYSSALLFQIIVMQFSPFCSPCRES